ncbi:MAG: tRNA (N(6)-L-threonylcarbamoyladenosine(37)-C(2))-methylthiotransferase MtaB [Bdellovibrionota bacterium]|nr:tRNA (N(6)-L-threonylcarbamoyladenosine(37)-C(2))-methylthiotransferase MtaB [Bdellovibrionota bacterium]
MENTDLNKKRVALHTLGCRLNFSETGSIAKGFQERGYEVVDFGEPADVSFINTCTVTDGADSTCRNLIRKAHKASPEGKIVVAGCYAQMDSERISKMTGVDLVLGTSEKYKVFDYLEEDGDDVVHIDKTTTFYGAATSEAEGHTRAFLKIQDGCNYVCSFCIIPQARGRSRALPISDAVENAKRVVADGFKEVVLTGVNIGEYEANTGERLTELVYRLLEIDGLERLRLGSVEPNTITDELLEAFKSSPKFMEHFHVPLQSGDDDILTLMRRKYDVSHYRKTIDKIITAFPDAGIGADVICGFPGETEEQFKNTYNLLKELPITHFHIFPYSSRKNTIAARMENHIQHGVKKDRVRALTMFGEAKLEMFSQDQVGGSSEVLFERLNKHGYWEGYTRNYVRVWLKSSAELKNKIHHVFLKDYDGGHLIGELLN